MFEAIRRLFWKTVRPPADAPPVEEEPAAAPAPAPASPAVAPAPAPAPAPSPPPARIGDAVVLPLNEILSRLPDGLTHLILTRPGGSVSFSINIVWEQLRTGAVRVSFGQLREGSPPGTFAVNASHDDSLIDLPLPLVLAAIGPGGLARRSDQKRVEVSDEVTGVFGARPACPGGLFRPPSRRSRPPPPRFVRRLRSNLSHPPRRPRPRPNRRLPSRRVPAARKPVSQMPFVTARHAAAPAPSGGTVVTTLETVSGAWPDPVRQEIQQLGLGLATISIPVNRLEDGMKTGRVVFTWAELCGWLSVPTPPPTQGQCQVELPLNVIAPLFLAKLRVTTPRKTVAIGENVPDLFASMARPVEPPPAPAPAVSAPPPAAAPAGPNVFGEIFGQPSETDWTPQGDHATGSGHARSGRRLAGLGRWLAGGGPDARAAERARRWPRSCRKSSRASAVARRRPNWGLCAR